MAFFTSLGTVALCNDIYSSLAKKGVMASPPNFTISPGNPSGPTELFLLIFANIFLITLVLKIKASPSWLILFSGCYNRCKTLIGI